MLKVKVAQSVAPHAVRRGADVADVVPLKRLAHNFIELEPAGEGGNSGNRRIQELHQELMW